MGEHTRRLEQEASELQLNVIVVKDEDRSKFTNVAHKALPETNRAWKSYKGYYSSPILCIEGDSTHW
jgi:RNA binding exosome subunit